MARRACWLKVNRTSAGIAANNNWKSESLQEITRRKGRQKKVCPVPRSARTVGNQMALRFSSDMR
jgi:hypothetical protein